nr:hypothetical protein [Haloprofundus halophilus]
MVTPSHYTGVVRLPSGRLLEIRPKIDCNLLYFLAYTGRIDEVSVGREATVNEGRSFVDLLGWLFLKELQNILQQGIHREYSLQEESESYIRGTLDVNKQLQKGGFRNARFECRFDELTADIPLNQILLEATDILSSAVTSRSLQSDLRRSYARLHRQVSTPAICPDPSEVELTRLNSHYDSILRLAELILSEVYIQDVSRGSVDIDRILLNTEILFENVVFCAVKRVAEQMGLIIGGDGNPEESSDRSIGNLLQTDSGAHLQRLDPDIILRGDARRVVVVGDAKWKNARRPSREDLYQMSAYQAQQGTSGLLVYPDTSGEIKEHYRYTRNDERNTPLRVTKIETGHASPGHEPPSYADFCDSIESEIETELRELLA